MVIPSLPGSFQADGSNRPAGPTIGGCSGTPGDRKASDKGPERVTRIGPGVIRIPIVTSPHEAFPTARSGPHGTRVEDHARRTTQGTVRASGSRVGSDAPTRTSHAAAPPPRSPSRTGLHRRAKVVIFPPYVRGPGRAGGRLAPETPGQRARPEREAARQADGPDVPTPGRVGSVPLFSAPSADRV